MRYKEITEAPIGNIEVHNMDQPGTFSDADRKLLTNPAHIQRIKNRFELNTFQFDLYFINQPGVEYATPLAYPPDDDVVFKRTNAFTNQWQNDLKDYAGVADPVLLKTKFGITIAPDPESITVAYLSNANEENSIPITPCIVAHRFGHALTDEPERLTADIKFALRQIPDAWTSPLSDLGITIPFCKLLTTRAARTGIMPYEEMREELIAQYLTVGGVSFAIPQMLKNSISGDEPSSDTRWAEQVARTVHMTAAIDDRLKKLGMRITVLIDRILNECLGRIFIAV